MIGAMSYVRGGIRLSVAPGPVICGIDAQGGMHAEWKPPTHDSIAHLEPGQDCD